VSAELEALLQQLEPDALGRVKYGSFRDLLQRSYSKGPHGSSSCSSLRQRGSRAALLQHAASGASSNSYWVKPAGM
jgi:hypothetical protein